MNRYMSVQETQSYLALCDKIRLLSSLSKMKNCASFYVEKNRLIEWITINWPMNVRVLDSQDRLWLIELRGVGKIHCDSEALSENTKQLIFYQGELAA